MSGAPTTERTAPAPGTVLCGKYRVERELGSGGMGTVVVARHLKLDSLLAIKLLPASTPSDPYLAARFLREARAMARLASEHVVRVLDLDETPDGGPVLVMELLDGQDLERALAEGPLAPARAVDLALQACAALAEAHARGIVHRDVKPANLFVVRRLDGREQLKLLDFGISKVSGEDLRLTHTALGLGSPLFMSPEQLLAPSRVDLRTDVWSLGVTLYRLLSAQAPYPAKDLTGLAAQIAAHAPTPLLELAPALDPALAAVVMRCLEKDVEARWPSAVALAAALEPFRGPDSVGSAAAVRQAEAFGTQAAAGAPLLAEAPPEDAAPPGARTLSHDLPRVDAPIVGLAQGGQAPPGAAVRPATLGGTAATGASTPRLETLGDARRGSSWRRTGSVLAAGAVLVAAGAALVWPSSPRTEAGPPQPQPAPLVRAETPPTPSLVRPPPEPTPVPSGAVATGPARGQEAATRRAAPDAGVPRQGKPADAPHDPADLEIKE